MPDLKNEFLKLESKGFYKICAKDIRKMSITTSLIEMSLLILSFMSGDSDTIKKIIKDNFIEYIKISHNFLHKITTYGFEIADNTLIPGLISSLYRPIEKIYIANQTMQQYFDTNLQLNKDDNLCFFLLEIGLNLISFKSAILLSLNDFEFLLLSWFEILRQKATNKTEDFNFHRIAFDLYLFFGDTRAALHHYKLFIKDFSKIFSSQQKVFIIQYNIFDHICQALSDALRKNLMSPQEVMEEVSNISKFLNELKKEASLKIPKNIMHTPNSEAKKLCQKATIYETEINKKISLFNQLKKECEKLIPVSKTGKKKPKKNSPPKVPQVPAPVGEYKLLEEHLIPKPELKKVEIISILNPPPSSVTIRVSDEDEEKTKQINYNKRKKSEKQQSSSASSASSLSSSSSSSSSTTSDDPAREIKTRVFEFINPMSHAVIHGQINFGQAGQIISDETMKDLTRCTR